MAAPSEAIDVSIRHLDVSEMLTVGPRRELGGSSDIYSGFLKREGGEIAVAIKAFRIPYDPQNERFQKHFLREVNVWGDLNHPNIVPLLGYSIDPERGFCLISPWYEHGHLTKYLDSNSDADRAQLLLEVLYGMGYLESCGRVHGDLKSFNILVDEGGHARICDFGATRFINQFTGLTTSQQNQTATERYLSPERILEPGPPTIASDVWAFGCIVIEVMARQPPHNQFVSNHLVYKAIIKGKSPLDPKYDLSIAPGRKFWKIIQQCWRFDPSRRPTIDQLIDHIRRSLPDGIRGPPETRSPRLDWSEIGPYLKSEVMNRLKKTIPFLSLIGNRSNSPNESND